MKNIFSEQKWEILTSIWQKDKPEREDILSIEDQETNELLKFQFQSRCAIKLSKCHDRDANAAWKKVKKQILIEQKKRKIRHIRLYAAAIILLLIIIGGVRLYLPAHEQVIHEIPVTISSGTSKAKLFLANGDCIELSDTSKNVIVKEFGIALVNDTQDGKLHYYADGENVQHTARFNVLDVPKSGEYSLILPDGSIVWLNSESSLRFPVSFSSNRRDVYLSGEAFFKVAEDQNAPFHVHIGENDIRVLGTEFNVCAYTNETSWSTTLIKGSVRINNKVTLEPSQQYTLEPATGRSELKSVETGLYTSWMDGKFYFRGFTFEEIVNKLERWYDFKMFYQNEEIKQMRFSGTINKHRPINEMLQFLEKTTNIRFRINGKTIIASKIY